jgi:hypothetical protein
MLNMTKMQNRKGKKIHLLNERGYALCGRVKTDAVIVPPEGPKCNCEQCLVNLKRAIWEESQQPDFRAPSRFESFNEQRHSLRGAIIYA